MGNSPENNNRKWMALLGIPLQMGIIIFIFTYAGIWLDEKYSKEPYSVWTIVLSIFSVFVALYNVIRQVKELNKK